MISILNGDARRIPLADQSVQCIVTSPPYLGLRDYGIADQIGLEPTPAAYVASIVAVMRECWRVLKDDGVLWLNLGDSYARNGGEPGGGNRELLHLEGNQNRMMSIPDGSGLKPKDLCGIPWRVAFALQSDGAASPETMLAVSRIRAALLSDFDSWDSVPDKTRNVIDALDREWEDAHRGAWYLRQDIIWSKPNPIPESVTDRCTKAHEYVFLLTKQAQYYYDAEAVKEESTGQTGTAANFARDTKNADVPGQARKSHRLDRDTAVDNGQRNRRSVWTVATSPYSGSHFATFPPKLVEPMILAGTSQRGECPHCGKAWVRVMERVNGNTEAIERPKKTSGMNSSTSTLSLSGNGSKEWAERGSKSTTTGWRQQCDCPPHEPIPQTVLDPFAGSGTVGKVAIANGRRAVMLDLNLKYIDLQFERTSGVQIGLSL